MVDTKQLMMGSVGLGAAFFAVVLLVIMFSQIDESNVGVRNVNVNTTANPVLSPVDPVGNIAGNSTNVLGSIVTTWGSILVLGLIILSAFVAILGALIFLANRQGR